jgi:alpha-tubulin suppressor-like RCC1 family protein
MMAVGWFWGMMSSGIGCGEDHALIVTAQGAVYAWGVGDMYQLGTQRASNEAVPTRVDTGARKVKIVAGGTHHSVFVYSP